MFSIKSLSIMGYNTSDLDSLFDREILHLLKGMLRGTSGATDLEFSLAWGYGGDFTLSVVFPPADPISYGYDDKVVGINPNLDPEIISFQYDMNG